MNKPNINEGIERDNLLCKINGEAEILLRI